MHKSLAKGDKYHGQREAIADYIEPVSLEARVVVASVETYLSYAEAIGLTRLVAAPAAAAIAAPAADIAVSELEIIVPAA